MEEVFKHSNLFKTEKLLKIQYINIIRNNIIIKHTTSLLLSLLSFTFSLPFCQNLRASTEKYLNL